MTTARLITQLEISKPSEVHSGYFASALDLQQGSTIREIPLGHLSNDLLVEFLRLRRCWQDTGAIH